MRRLPSLLIVLLLAALGLAVFRYQSQPDRIASGAILEWFQKPAAVHFVGKYDRTYYSWISHRGKIQLRFFDHRTHRFSSTTTVRDLSRRYGEEAIDDHNAPSLQILPDGKLLIYYAVHDIDRALFVQRSLEPENIADWHDPQNLATFDQPGVANYPKPARLPSGELVLFFRQGAFNNSREVLSRSNDNGRTWSTPSTLIDFGRGQGVYSTVVARENTIQVAWSIRPLTSDQHQSTINIYTTRSDDGGIRWSHSDGSITPTPITNDTAELVYNSGSDPAFIWDVVLDPVLQPRIAFATKTDPKHEFRFARLINGVWSTEKVTTSRQLYPGYHFYSGGIVIDPDNPDIVYLSKARQRLELERWAFSNNQWSHQASLTANSPRDNFRPQVVFNGRPDARVVWSAGQYDGLIDNQWSGFQNVSLQSPLTTQ